MVQRALKKNPDVEPIHNSVPMNMELGISGGGGGVGQPINLPLGSLKQEDYSEFVVSFGYRASCYFKNKKI